MKNRPSKGTESSRDWKKDFTESLNEANFESYLQDLQEKQKQKNKDKDDPKINQIVN